MQPHNERTHAWRAHGAGGGSLLRTAAGLRLVNLPAPNAVYSNAQIDDHAHLLRSQFAWMPPARLALRARFSAAAHMLAGTAGFGFWNDPFAMTGRRLPALPHAAWFFLAAQPSNIAPALGVPGSGWKAAVMDVAACPFAALLPTAPIVLPVMRNARLRRALWPVAQWALGADERPLDDDITAWHSYSVEWRAASVCFHVDGRCVLESRRAPQGPLGVVIWMDNQYLIATPQGRFGYGVVAQREVQWLEVADVIVE